MTPIQAATLPLALAGHDLIAQAKTGSGKTAAIAEASRITPEWHKLDSLVAASDEPLLPSMSTLLILGGKQEKIRPGDVLSALTGEASFTREQVGKINVTEQNTYVAVERGIAGEAVRRLGAGRIKGKTVKVRRF